MADLNFGALVSDWYRTGKQDCENVIEDVLPTRAELIDDFMYAQADDLPAATVTVVLPEAQRERLVAHQPCPIALTGRLEFGPAEDESGRVSWLRLHLTPDALAPAAAAAPAPRR